MEWYRNTEWSDEIAADFERRLARSRHQKAQNLSLQGYHLIAKHPDVARTLLERAVAMDDPFETPRALSHLATAQLALRDVDAALTTYETALTAQAAQPNLIAVHAADYVFLVGAMEKSDRLPTAEPMADAMPDESIFGPDPQFLAAKALVFALAGRAADAREAAAKALPLWPDADTFALGIDFAEVRSRLEALAAS